MKEKEKEVNKVKDEVKQKEKEIDKVKQEVSEDSALSTITSLKSQLQVCLLLSALWCSLTHLVLSDSF